VKKPLAALLLAAATVAALAVPAGAAVPKTATDLTFPCNDGSGKSAQVWSTRYFAAKNPCRSSYLVIGYGGSPDSQSSGSMVDVAPGAHFSQGRRSVLTWQVHLGQPDWCSGYDGNYVVTPHSHGKFVPSNSPEC
jgi:hypothetical protein